MISLEIYDCAASFNSRYVTIDDVDKVNTEFQKIGDLKIQLLRTKKKKKSKSRASKRNVHYCEVRLSWVPDLSPNPHPIDARKLDICVSFLLDAFGVLTVSATCPQRHKAGATVQFEMHSRMALKESQVSHFQTQEREKIHGVDHGARSHDSWGEVQMTNDIPYCERPIAIFLFLLLIYVVLTSHISIQEREAHLTASYTPSTHFEESD